MNARSALMKIDVQRLGKPAVSSVLYVTYDGLLEPLGQSQVVAYIAHLAGEHRIHILSFEKPLDRNDATRMNALRTRLDHLGIGWTPLPYHKTPSAPATGFDISVGIVAALWLTLRHRVRILHARSYVSALIALAVKRLTGAKFLFDMRGLWADERVDGGLWPKQGALYRVTKSLERRFLRQADHIVTLTSASVPELCRLEGAGDLKTRISVIPTCTDVSRFRPAGAPPRDPLVFGYVGSVGTWYLFEETLSFFRHLQQRIPGARMLIVNRLEHDLIRRLAERAGLSMDSIDLVAAEHHEVPRFIQQMHLGASLIRPCYSKIASAPTKMAEYLACGVACLGNTGVGDVGEVLQSRKVGVVLDAFATSDLDHAVTEALELLADRETASRCVRAAKELFSLEIGVDSYRLIYASLALDESSNA